MDSLNKPLRILIDMDAILADLLTAWLGIYNDKYNDNVTKSDIHSWDVHKYVKSECGMDIYDLPSVPGTYLNLTPLPGALDSVNQLLDMGHEVVIVSAHSKQPHNTTEKMQWLYNHLPRIGYKNVFFAHKKSWVKGDILIDDSPNNIINYKAAWPESKIMTIAYNYNVSVKDKCDVYARDYNNTEKAWAEILTAIKEL